jgi:hypothetical protein
MARLFITPREQNFISDITKELLKDVVGQKIFYYSISEKKTKVHGVYNESQQKIWEAPIEIDALVDSPKVETKTALFGVEQTYKIEVYLQYRDLIDKNINVAVGDFFSYGDVFYEINIVSKTRSIYGQVEQIDGVKLEATKARQGQFDAPLNGPLAITYTDPNAVQDTFVQQRGFVENRLGDTADVRDLQRNGVLDPPLSGPQEVSKKGDKTGSGSSFYDEE